MLISKDAAAALEMRRSHSLATLVQQEIERLILDGDLKAGERLNENAYIVPGLGDAGDRLFGTK